MKYQWRARKYYYNIIRALSQTFLIIMSTVLYSWMYLVYCYHISIYVFIKRNNSLFFFGHIRDVIRIRDKSIIMLFWKWFASTLNVCMNVYECKRIRRRRRVLFVSDVCVVFFSFLSPHFYYYYLLFSLLLLLLLLLCFTTFTDT